MAVRFNRPPPGPRVKFLKAYQSDLAVGGGSTFEVGIRNTGEAGADIFNLQTSLSKTSWSVALKSPDGSTLIDTNGDSLLDTGLVNQGSTITLTVDLRPTDPTMIGDNTRLVLNAASTQDPGRQSTTTLESAVPASFAQTFADGQSGASLELIWSQDRKNNSVAPNLTSTAQALSARPDGTFVFAWEKTGFNGAVAFSNIEYALLNRMGEIDQDATALQDNAEASIQTIDHSPALASSADGRVGVAWVRDKFDLSTLKTNSNVYLAILDSEGQLAQGPLNVTNNTAWRGGGDLGIPMFAAPRISGLGEGQFVLAWIDERLESGGQKSELAYAVFGTSGNEIVGASLLHQSTAGGTRYLDPSLGALTSGQAFLAYTLYDPAALSYAIAYTILDPDGSKAVGETTFTGNEGWRPDSVQLNSGTMLLAWTDPSTDNIEYALLEDIGYSVVAGPTALATPDGRAADFVSVTLDKTGPGVLTWMDADQGQRLYYALVGDDGVIMSPPIIFRSGAAGGSGVFTSSSGHGLAPYEGSWQIYLPVLVR